MFKPSHPQVLELANAIRQQVRLLATEASEQAQGSAEGAACPAERVHALLAALHALCNAERQYVEWVRQHPDVTQFHLPGLLASLQPQLGPAAAVAPLLRQHWAQPKQAATDRRAGAHEAA